MAPSLKEVEIEKREFAPYQKFNKSLYTDVIKLAGKLKGKRILHVNSSSGATGGVAELLKSQVALEKGLGIDSHWYIIEGNPKFFGITKKVHNLLQGKPGMLTKDEKETYVSHNKQICEGLSEFFQRLDPDIVLIHDPQPVALQACLPERTKSLLRIHIDLSAPNPATLEFFRPFIEKYEHVILSRRDYRPLWLPTKKLTIITPTIDPLSDKNKEMPTRRAEEILMNHGIHPDYPQMHSFPLQDLSHSQCRFHAE